MLSQSLPHCGIRAFYILRLSKTIFVFNKFYLDRDPDEVAKLLHLQPPLQPPIERVCCSPSPTDLSRLNLTTRPESQTTTRPPELGAAFHRAAQTHLQSISRIVESMRHQRSALRLASSVVDFHVLNVRRDDARQELEKRAARVEGVDGAMDLASRVRIHREFMSTAVQRAMDAVVLRARLDIMSRLRRYARAVEEFRKPPVLSPCVCGYSIS